MAGPDAGTMADAWRCYRRAWLVGAAGLAVAALLAWGLAPALGQRSWLTRFLFLRQDLWFVVGWLVLALAQGRRGAPHAMVVPRRLRAWQAGLIALCLLLVCRIGHHLVFADYDLSRDEQLAGFDATIYAHGAVFAPLPDSWRPWVGALNQLFLLIVGNREGWVSSYLPVNAAARALVGAIVDPAWTSPLFVAGGAVALWSVARRLWPDSAGARWTALLLYAGSSQVLVAGMTAYAMSGHLALDLVWLALFLRGGRVGHGGAILTGLFATGLHQPLFHPLFALPFVELLWRRGERRLFVLYGLSYGAIGLFWLAWPSWVASHATTAVPPGLANDGVGYLDRVSMLVPLQSITDAGLLAANLVRFVTWQHLLAVPLAIVGVATSWRRDPFVRALARGLVLPAVAVFLLLPYQGHGWGYRYLHGVIGNLVLLGGYGWSWCERKGLSLGVPLLATTAASLFALFPLHALVAQRQAAPYAALDHAIAATRADLVVIDDDAAPFALDLVLNRPWLDNRPLRMRASLVDPARLPALCRGRTLAFVGGARFDRIMAYFGLTPATTTPAQRRLERVAAAAGCRVEAG